MKLEAFILAELKFYTYPSCTSCRKTKKWLVENQIVFEERHLFRQTPSVEEIKFLLSLTSEGLDEILATRSQSFKELNLEIDDLPLSKVVELIVENPKLLRSIRIAEGKKNAAISYLNNKVVVCTPGTIYPDFLSQKYSKSKKIKYKQEFYSGRANQWKIADYY